MITEMSRKFSSGLQQPEASIGHDGSVLPNPGWLCQSVVNWGIFVIIHQGFYEYFCEETVHVVANTWAFSSWKYLPKAKFWVRLLVITVLRLLTYI